MSITVSTTVSTSAIAGPATGSAATATAAADAESVGSGAPVSATAKAHAQLNGAIVQASLNVAISSGNEPLALLYKSAITGINESLKDQFGEDAIQNAVSQDNTPGGTAGRIVSLATAFYGAYRQQHQGEDEAAVRHNFVETLRGGVERGFKEARDILNGLQVLDGGVASAIDQTFTLVQQGLADFEAAPEAAAKAPAQPPA